MSIDTSSTTTILNEAFLQNATKSTQQDSSLTNNYDCYELIREKQEVVKERKQNLRSELILSGGGELMTESRRKITELRPVHLLRELREGSLTATQVLEAFQAKALESEETLNAVTEIIPYAKVLANELDKLPKNKRRSLHGLPISVKDNFDVKGLDTTMGLVKRINKPASHHAALIEAMIDEGAVPFCKTNVPQSLLSYDCSNPIYGKTNNPHDTTRTCGGSSGGEGSIIGGRASILGLGSDVGGSARVPALFCGCVGFKCTFSRFSSKGMNGIQPVRVGIMAVPGIFGHDVSIVAAAAKSALHSNKMFSLDPVIPPIHWRDEIYNPSIERPLLTPRLRIGWYEQFDYLPVTPCARRAVREARDALTAAGHTLVPFMPPTPEYVWKLLMSLFNADQAQYLLNEVKGEVIDQSISTNVKLMGLHWGIKTLMKPFLSWKMPITSKLLEASSTTTYECLQALSKRKNYIETFISQWKNENIDVLLCPGFPSTAPKHGDPTKLLPCGIYSILYNLCDFPAGVVPVIKQTKEDLEQLKDYEAKEPFQRVMKETTLNGGEGLPMGVQIVGLPFQEELVLYGMKEVENCF